MTKTQNYSLNQWDASDAIRRADFNADNAAIDSALAGLAGSITAETNARTAAVTAAKQEAANALAAYKTANDAAVAALGASSEVTLLDVTTQTAAQQVDFDVSGIDFTQYWRVDMFLDCDMSSATSYVYVRTNGLTTGYTSCLLSSNSSTEYEYMFYLYFGAYTVRGEFMQPKQGFTVSAILHQALHNSAGNRGYCHSTCGLSPVKWENLNSLNLYSVSGTVPAGTRLILRGVKK